MTMSKPWWFVSLVVIAFALVGSTDAAPRKDYPREIRTREVWRVYPCGGYWVMDPRTKPDSTGAR